jgi:hypothetical protein
MLRTLQNITLSITLGAVFGSFIASCANDGEYHDADATILQAQAAAEVACATPEAEVLMVMELASRMGGVPSTRACQGSNPQCKLGWSKWKNVREHAKNSVKDYAKKGVRFGALLFPEVAWGTPGSQSKPWVCDWKHKTVFNSWCNELTTNPAAVECRVGEAQFAVSTNSASLDDAKFWQGDITPEGKASVAQALARAYEHFANRPADGKSRHVVLVTDGTDQCSGNAKEAIKMLRSINVDVWVVGFKGSNNAALNELASAGSRSRVGDTAFWPMASGFDPVFSRIFSDKTAKAEVCDGEVDENLSQACTVDGGEGTQICVDDNWSECEPPDPTLVCTPHELLDTCSTGIG